MKNCTKLDNIFNNMFYTGLFLSAFCGIWRYLEVAVYGAPQESIVDTIMMLLFTPFLYMAVAHIRNATKNRQN